MFVLSGQPVGSGGLEGQKRRGGPMPVATSFARIRVEDGQNAPKREKGAWKHAPSAIPHEHPPAGRARLTAKLAGKQEIGIGPDPRDLLPFRSRPRLATIRTTATPALLP